MGKKAGKKKKPPLRWRRHLIQAELELPPPAAVPSSADDDEADEPEELEYEWWQTPTFVSSLALLTLLMVVLGGHALYAGHRDRALAAEAAERARALTLRASTAERRLRIAPNPTSFSANPDATLVFPDPPEMLDVFLPVAYSDFTTFWLAIDKVDEGRVMVVQRMVPDSNKDLRLSLNSSSFGPGEYRIRLQGYTWNGERVDAGWARLVVQ